MEHIEYDFCRVSTGLNNVSNCLEMRNAEPHNLIELRCADLVIMYSQLKPKCSYREALNKPIPSNKPPCKPHTSLQIILLWIPPCHSSVPKRPNCLNIMRIRRVLILNSLLRRPIPVPPFQIKLVYPVNVNFRT